MAFRCLVFSSPVSLSVKNKQLVVDSNKTVGSIPIEDIQAILFENQHVMASVYLLGKLVCDGITVYFCDEKHLPCAVLLPFYQHSRNTGVVRVQEGISLPLKKSLWKCIVVVKILNQAECLKLCNDISGYRYLVALAKSVKSGDSQNVEAVAANYYFKRLFGADFSRDNNNARNSALNYGYAIMRGLIARLVTGYGFLPMKGLFHDNVYNSFKLADDLMEPFRPVVDLFVVMNVCNDDSFSSDCKHQLFNLLNVDMLFDGKLYCLSYAAELMVRSFSHCCRDSSVDFCIPKLVSLCFHKYE